MEKIVVRQNEAEQLLRALRKMNNIEEEESEEEFKPLRDVTQRPVYKDGRIYTNLSGKWIKANRVMLIKCHRCIVYSEEPTLIECTDCEVVGDKAYLFRCERSKVRGDFYCLRQCEDILALGQSMEGVVY